MKQLNIKTPLVFRLSLVLLCTLLITTNMTSGLYARYTTTATGSDSARVARFEFTDNSDTYVQTLIKEASTMFPGETISVQAKVVNNGEVTLCYTIKVENLTENLPIEDAILASRTLSPGETAEVNIALSWPAEKNSVDYVGKTDVLRISVLAEQVD